jgi:hypothetical protein
MGRTRMTVHPSVASVANPSDAQSFLLRRILKTACAVDFVCPARDRHLEDRVGLTTKRPHVVATTLSPKDILAVEDSAPATHRELAELHAGLAPLAVEWVSDLPNVPAQAAAEGESADGLIDERILKRLFERAGIAQRFVPTARAKVL